MSQVTTGLRSLLSHPIVYDSFQRILGDASARRRFSRDHLRPRPGDVLVDIGCGTAEILRYLPGGVRYYGFDLSPEYIEAARERHDGRP
ncbi:MAG: class I SAM-dependent methyltransferase, partial [Myxococcales bacterium]